MLESPNFDIWENHESYALEETTSGSVLYVTGSLTAELVERLASGTIYGLSLNYAHGFIEPDLDFIQDWPIKALHIISRNIKDITPIKRLSHNLMYLYVEASRTAKLGLEGFEKLEYLGCPWSYVSKSIVDCQSIEHIFFLSYSENSLEPLADLAQLHSISMKQYPRISTLAGINRFEKLETLEIYSARNLSNPSNLRDIKGIESFQRLILDSCSQIDNLKDISFLTNLTWLDVSNCKEIDSVKPLEMLPYLETLFLAESTNISDGDLSPISGLGKLRRFGMKNRRHYNPSVPELHKLIESRTRE